MRPWQSARDRYPTGRPHAGLHGTGAGSTHSVNTASIAASDTGVPASTSPAWVNSGMIIFIPSSGIFRCTPGACARKRSQCARTRAQ